jgi:hypothetical protein
MFYFILLTIKTLSLKYYFYFNNCFLDIRSNYYQKTSAEFEFKLVFFDFFLYFRYTYLLLQQLFKQLMYNYYLS